MSIAKKSLKLGFKKANFTLKQKQEEYLKIMMESETRSCFPLWWSGNIKELSLCLGSIKSL
jgi:hypothetical protein